MMATKDSEESLDGRQDRVEVLDLPRWLSSLHSPYPIVYVWKSTQMADQEARDFLSSLLNKTLHVSIIDGLPYRESVNHLLTSGRQTIHRKLPLHGQSESTVRIRSQSND